LDIRDAQHVGNDLVVTMANGSFRIVDHFSGHTIENIADGTMVLATGLVGGNGSGIIAGGNGGETLDGAGGDDFLFGGNGRDRLIGGVGDDRLTGGPGHDTFVFGPGFGHDVVTDFSHADTIEFEDGTFDNFKDVRSAARQVGNDVLITLDADNSVLLAGVDIRSLHASDFHF
jgi:Ca2+-binding RTX toxin-like protein